MIRSRDNIVITGFMGTGKTSVGQVLAARLNRPFVDMDAVIESRQNMSIVDIFQQKGEAHFREIETDLVRELSTREGLVIATGGGALLTDLNRELLAASGLLVCLNASPDELLHRLELASDRPLLNYPNPQGRIAALLAARADAYARIPNQINTTGLTVEEVADRILAIQDHGWASSITVHHPAGEYHIDVARGILASTGRLLREHGLGGRIALVSNPIVDGLYGDIVRQSCADKDIEIIPCHVPDGEEFKNLDTVSDLYDQFVAADLDRRTAVLALGGGVIGDLAGFAAATYLRGVAFVQVPTTLLAMVDSSVGGKTGVDHKRGKNLVGAFKQPELVIADPNVLDTLPSEHLAGGMAELVKHGVLQDPLLFEQVERFGPGPVPWLLDRSIRVKVAVVEEDPYERGRRAVLNLGHTFAHAWEWLSGYSLPHGQAVGMGMLAAARLAALTGNADHELAERIERVLGGLGLPMTYRGHTPEEVIAAMSTDKKRQGGRLRFVLPRAIGDVVVTDDIDREDVIRVLEGMHAN